MLLTQTCGGALDVDKYSVSWVLVALAIEKITGLLRGKKSKKMT